MTFWPKAKTLKIYLSVRLYWNYFEDANVEIVGEATDHADTVVHVHQGGDGGDDLFNCFSKKVKKSLKMTPKKDFSGENVGTYRHL